MLIWAKLHGIELVLFINPYHSDYLVQIEMAGMWPLFEDWKRQVTALTAEYAIPLWDFNSIEPYSTESPPAFNDKRSLLRWFWEPAHYRHELGNRMLGAMLAQPVEKTGNGKNLDSRSRKSLCSPTWTASGGTCIDLFVKTPR